MTVFLEEARGSGRCPLVSILVPAYNHESFIGEALDSLMNQSYPNLELLLIDDGSSDGTVKIIDSYRNKLGSRFSRSWVVSKSHSGLKANLNLMIKEARGEYVFIMASDDVADPHAIETLVDFLEKHCDYVLAVGNNDFIDGNSDKLFLRSGNKTHTSQEDNLKIKNLVNKKKFGTYMELLKGNHVPNGYLIRRNAIERVGGYQFALEDWGLNLQLSKFGKFEYIPKILLSYRLHGGNTILQYNYKSSQKKFFSEVYRNEFSYNLKTGNIVSFALYFIRYYILRFYTPVFLKKIMRKFINEPN